MMPKQHAAANTGNRLLNLLEADDFASLQPHLRKAELQAGQTLYHIRGPVEQIYFPINCVLSVVSVMLDGRSIEVASIGNEGLTGLPAFGVLKTSPHRVFVQIAGDAWQADAEALNRASGQLPKLREVLAGYHQAFLFQISQCLACNGLHLIAERCCRWLLMTHDRVDGDDLALTHGFLSFMLGVRRSSITAVLQTLQQRKLISNRRGLITVLNREGLEESACECYAHIQDEYQRVSGNIKRSGRTLKRARKSPLRQNAGVHG